MATPSPPLVGMSSSPSPPPLPVSHYRMSIPTTNNSIPQSHRLRDLPQASSNEAIKAYASLSVKLSEMSELLHFACVLAYVICLQFSIVILK